MGEFYSLFHITELRPYKESCDLIKIILIMLIIISIFIKRIEFNKNYCRVFIAIMVKQVHYMKNAKIV
jgi:hypothetical protein